MKNLTIYVVIYAVLLLTLTVLGIKSQSLYRHLNGSRKTAGLLEQKYELLEKITDLRHQVEQIKGPAAIRSWASEHNMVPINQLERVQVIEPISAPKIVESPKGNLEVYTIWR